MKLHGRTVRDNTHQDLVWRIQSINEGKQLRRSLRLSEFHRPRKAANETKFESQHSDLRVEQ
jgi:hypothetical protein